MEKMKRLHDFCLIEDTPFVVSQVYKSFIKYIYIYILRRPSTKEKAIYRLIESFHEMPCQLSMKCVRIYVRILIALPIAMRVLIHIYILRLKEFNERGKISAIAQGNTISNEAMK